jgi:hypothetical protein
MAEKHMAHVQHNSQHRSARPVDDRNERNAPDRMELMSAHHTLVRSIVGQIAQQARGYLVSRRRPAGDQPARRDAWVLNRAIR